jgi:hypothetical protein
MKRLRIVGPVITFLALLLVTAANDVSAQSALDTADAQEFLGSWTITLESPDGDFPLVVDLTDASGKLAMRVGDGQQGQDVTNVTRTGEELVGRYTMSYQGMQIPVVVRLDREGDNVQSSWDFADGAFMTSAVGTLR